MDFDMTQLVTQSDTEGEDEENGRSAPVAHIKVLNQPSLKNKLYPILKGDNTVGRQDLCQVSIPVRSLSKKHACIEVRGRSHFIYDMGSRNRTRRGTHYLTPEVRYELRNNDMVVFADVSCIYLVEDSARASDSGSETDPLSDSETVFHTVAVDMYHSMEPTVNRVIEVAVASDPNSCDSAASSDIIMPTQDFTISKIKQESQIQTDIIQGSEPPVIKHTSEEAIKFLVADSDSENDHENQVTGDFLCFQNNGNNDNSLDLDLLSAPTQAYVADSEDDDNKSEILDMVHDYKTTDNQSALFVADTQSDNSLKPPNTDSEESIVKIDRNGSASPFQTFLTIDSSRTYSKKGTSNKSDPEIIPSKSDRGLEKPVEDFEETQDPNLFAMSTLVADGHVLASPDNKSPLVNPINDRNTTLDTTNDETETILVTGDDKDTLPVCSEADILLVTNEVATTNGVVTSDNISNTCATSNQEATIPISHTTSITKQNAITVSITKDNLITASVDKDDDNIGPILNDDAATLVVSGELTTVEVITDETMVVTINNNNRGTETVEVDQDQRESLNESKENDTDIKTHFKPAEQSEIIGFKNQLEMCKTYIPSEEPSSPIQLISVSSSSGNTTESKEKPLSETATNNESNSKLITPILATEGLQLDDNTVSVLDTPSGKGNSPKILMRQSDDEILDATQPYMIDCLDSPPVRKDGVKAKRSLPFDADNTEGSDGDIEDDTQPYLLEDSKDPKSNKKAFESHSFADFERDDAEFFDEGENSIERSQKERCSRSYQEAETLLLQAENESDVDKIVSESGGNQNVGAAAGRRRSKKVPAIRDTKDKMDKAEQTIQDVENKAEVSSQNQEKSTNIPKKSSDLASAKMTEFTEPSEVVHSEEVYSSASVAQMQMGEKRSTRRSSKDSGGSVGEKQTVTRNSKGSTQTLGEKKATRNSLKDSDESGETAVRKSGGRGRKRKIVGEKESTNSAGQSSKIDCNIGAKEKVCKEKEIHYKTKKPRRSVQFAGISSSEESSQEIAGTCSSRSQRGLNRESEVETVGRRRKGRPSTKQTNSKKCLITEDNNRPKDSQKTGNTGDKLEENPVIVDQHQSKRTKSNTILNECCEMNSKDLIEDNSIKGKKSNGQHKSQTNTNDNQKDKESGIFGNTGTDRKEEMTVATESTEEMLILRNEVLKKKNLKILETLSEVTSGPATQSNTIEDVVLKEAWVDKIEDGVSKLKTKNVEGKAANNFEKREPKLKTGNKMKKDSRKDRTSRATRSEKFKDPDVNEENITNDAKNEITEVPCNEGVFQTSECRDGSSTTGFENCKNIAVNDSNTKSSPRGKKGKAGKNKSQESEVPPNRSTRSNRASRSTRKMSQEQKVPDGTCATSEKKAVSQKRESSLSPQRNTNVSPDVFQVSESADVAKQKSKTPNGRKQNQSSQSSCENSSFTTPKRQQLNSSFPGTPSSRSSSKPKVMFTGVTDDKLQKIVTELGGIVVTSFDCCSHLVTDKIRRTVKFLCCLARGIPIVSPSWLTNCKTAKMFIDHTSHLLSDPSAEKQYKFSLKNSLQQARTGPLLENYRLHVTKSVKPNVDQMKEIMGSCKAQYLKRMPSAEEENTIVISCEEDRTLCQTALDAGIPIVNAEFILTGILQYDISVSKYQIFDSSQNKRKPSETDKGNATAKRRRR